MNELFPPNYDLNGIDAPAIKWALGRLPVGAERYTLAQNYYDGRHETAFATEKWRNAFGRLLRKLRLNMCPVPIDTLKDRLKIQGFTFVNQLEDDAEENLDDYGDPLLPPEVQNLARQVENRAREIWRRNRMKKRQGELFLETLIKGDGYLIVWPSRDGLATWFLNAAGTVAVSYDPENPGHILRAAKAWRTGKRVRLTLYYPDRIEKYITRVEVESLPGEAVSFKRFGELDGYGQPREPWPLPNPYGKVPVFHLANNAGLGQSGKSELCDLIPVQDAENKTVMDMMVAMEFAALPQRYATGVELPVDPATGQKYNPFDAGMDRLWHVGDENAQFGEFAAANLEGFLAVKRSFQGDFSTISRVPMHYYTLQNGDVPSGEALEMLENPLSAKVEDRQVSFGGPIEDAMRLSLEIEGVAGVEVETVWRDTTPRSRQSVIATLVQKLQIGISKRQAQREAGYSPSQIKRNEVESQEETQSAGDLMGGLFNQGAV